MVNSTQPLGLPSLRRAMCGPDAAFVTVPLCPLVNWCCPLPTPWDSSEAHQRRNAAPPLQIFPLHPDFSREATRDAKQGPLWLGQTTPRKIGVMVLEIIFLKWNWGGSGTMSGLESYYFPFSLPVSRRVKATWPQNQSEKVFSHSLYLFFLDRPKNISWIFTAYVVTIDIFFTPASHWFFYSPLVFTKARAFICSWPLSWAPAFFAFVFDREREMRWVKWILEFLFSAILRSTYWWKE